MSERTIEHVKQRLVEEGMEAALRRQPRSASCGHPKFAVAFEAHLVALACTPAPSARRGWTVRVFVGKAVGLGLVASVSPMTVQRMLRRRTQPHRKQYRRIPPIQNTAFVACMEGVFEVYTRPYNAAWHLTASVLGSTVRTTKFDATRNRATNPGRQPGESGIKCRKYGDNSSPHRSRHPFPTWLFPAVALLGPRQVGKTTLARSIADSGESVYLDLENPHHIRKLADPLRYLAIHEKRLVALDEVQRMPGLFEVLRGIIHEGRRRGSGIGRFLMSDSPAVAFLSQLGESLAGRIAQLEFRPFDVQEVDSVDPIQLWVRGGFPPSLLPEAGEESFTWREELIRTYLERDIPQLGPRIPATTLRRFWTMLAHSQGQVMNTARMA